MIYWHYITRYLLSYFPEIRYKLRFYLNMTCWQKKKKKHVVILSGKNPEVTTNWPFEQNQFYLEPWIWCISMVCYMSYLASYKQTNSHVNRNTVENTTISRQKGEYSMSISVETWELVKKLINKNFNLANNFDILKIHLYFKLLLHIFWCKCIHNF